MTQPVSEKDLAARKNLHAAGLRLRREGFVARTWGNISCRLDKTRFLITPSGISYGHLTPAQMVPVRLADLRYEGHLKPSSEKGMHAAIYQDRPEIMAIIHTHQPAASSVSAARIDMEIWQADHRQVIGPHVKTAPYALPGSRKLANGAMEALRESKAALLANHGALCIGENMAAAFEVCALLEDACEDFVRKKAAQYAGVRVCEPGMIHRLYLERIGGGKS